MRIVGILAVLLPAWPSSAQPVLQWELVGQLGGDVNSLAVKPGPAADGSTDTVFVAHENGLGRYSPGTPFVPDVYSRCGIEHVAVTREGNLLVGSRAGCMGDPRLSTDGGRTFEVVIPDHSLYCGGLQTTVASTGGALYACTGGLHRSFDGGGLGTWYALAMSGAASTPIDRIVELPASLAQPAGRLVAGTWGGIAYSDDGGTTWLWGTGADYTFEMRLAVAPDPTHPHGGTVYTGYWYGLSGTAAVFASENGGATWEARHVFSDGEFGVAETDRIELVATTEGALYASLFNSRAGPTHDLGVIIRSLDGGRNWELVSDGLDGIGVHALVLGRDGRLYAGTDHHYWQQLGGGLWRTIGPVVAAEPPAAEPQTELLLSIQPAPADDVATVSVVLPEAAHLRVSVWDLVGREIEILGDGWRQAGTHRLRFAADALSSGPYVVVAQAGAMRATAVVSVRH
jgi:hypothetical protein